MDMRSTGHASRYAAGLTTDIMDEARAMRDATMGRYLVMAWRGLWSVAARLLHAAHAPARAR
jgi:hypothetical protein